MSAGIDDPFHGISFDDDFVNAATRSERSADQRFAEAAWHRREAQQARTQRKQRRRRRLRLVVAMAGVVAVAALVVGFVAAGGPTSGHADIWEHVPTGDRPSLTTTTGERLAGAVPLPVGEGSAAFVSSRSDGLPVGFDPCRPVNIVVNPVGGPANAVEMVQVVADQVAAASGLSLVVEGLTDEPASPARPAYDPDRYGDRWSPILVAWSDPDVIADLDGDVIGLGGAATVAFERQEPYAVSGIVYLDAPQLDALTDIEMHTLVTMLHEFGHVVGLDHVDDATQVMNTQAVGTSYATGDLAGLAQLGAIPCAGRL